MLLRVPPLDHRDGPAPRGAQAILLGCTEIDPLVGPDDAAVPVFDTARLDADKAVELACEPLRALLRRTAPANALSRSPVLPGAGNNLVDVEDGRGDDRVVCASGTITDFFADRRDRIARSCLERLAGRIEIPGLVGSR
jgi:hypothetical protein